MAQVKELMLRAQHPDGTIADVEVSVRNVKVRRRDFEKRGYRVDVYTNWVEVQPPARPKGQVDQIGPWRVKRWWVPWIVFLVLASIPALALWTLVGSMMVPE